MMVVAVIKVVSHLIHKKRHNLHKPSKVANFSMVSANHTISTASNTSFSHDFGFYSQLPEWRKFKKGEIRKADRNIEKKKE